MNHLLNFDSWAQTIANQRADAILHGVSSQERMVLSPETGRILGRLSFETSDPFSEPQAIQIRGAVRNDLVNQAVRDLGSGLLFSVLQWANSPTTSDNELRQAYGELTLEDKKRSKGSEAGDRIGDFIKFLPKYGKDAAKATRILGSMADDDSSYQLYLREVAESYIRQALENREKKRLEEEEKHKNP